MFILELEKAKSLAGQSLRKHFCPNCTKRHIFSAIWDFRKKTCQPYLFFSNHKIDDTANVKETWFILQTAQNTNTYQHNSWATRVFGVQGQTAPSRSQIGSKTLTFVRKAAVTYLMKDTFFQNAWLSWFWITWNEKFNQNENLSPSSICFENIFSSSTRKVHFGRMRLLYRWRCWI